MVPKGLVIACRVDLAAGRIDEFLVSEVPVKVPVVRIEQAGSAHLGQRDDVRVVRDAGIARLHCSCIHLGVVHVPDEAREHRLSHPLPGRGPLEFFEELAPGDQPPAFLVAPLEELRTGGGTFVAEYLAGNVCVNDGAHGSQPQRPRRLFHEEPPVAVRCAEDVARLVEAERMNLHVQGAAFEVEDGYVVGLER